MKNLLFFLSLILFGCGGAANQTSSQPQLVNLEEKVEVPTADLRLFPEMAEVRAPEKFLAKFITTFGDFVISFERSSAPIGIDRFYSLVKAKYYEDILIFRAINNFMFQFGIHGDPEINAIWKERKIADDPHQTLSNKRGTISFASAGPNTRSHQLFINLVDNSRLDNAGFTPLGEIVEGLEVIERVNTEYGENRPTFQRLFSERGNPYAHEQHPKLDRIKKIIILGEK